MHVPNISKFFMVSALLIGTTSCSSNDASTAGKEARSSQNQIAEYIERHASEFLYRPEQPRLQSAPSYAWNDSTHAGDLPRVTKEYFRCRGTEFNPMRVVPNAATGPVYLHDCAGTDRHSLPLRNGEEFIYPILIDLLNDVQRQTGKRVVITSGHRCPAHNSYVDESPDSSASKHMIGAAVTFYVQGLEEQSAVVIQALMDHYRGVKEMAFTRDSSGKQASSTPLWLNKEIAIRLFNKHEGRNFDNRHPYPYISLTVRYDSDLNEKVIYSWDKAQRNYLRW